MAKSVKIPKRIAGIKIPKALRRSGRSLAGFLETPLGREVAAAALTAMAGVLAGSSRPVREAAGEVGRTAAQAGGTATGLVRDLAEAAVGAVADAARDFAAAGKGPPQGGKHASSGSKAH